MRLKSITKDQNDIKTHRDQRERHMGFTLHNEYNQPLPFFYTRENNTVPFIGNMRGAHAFLIASGPSFNLVDKDKLKWCWTICMNNSVKSCMPYFRPDAWCCVDDPTRFMTSIWLDPKIMKFVPHAHSEKVIWDSRAWEIKKIEDKIIKVGDCPNMFYFHRNEKFNAHRFLYEDCINWGDHTKWGGGRSVFLPTFRILHLLGFRNIYLLGVDFEMNENYKYSFQEKRDKSSISCNNSTYKKLIQRFTELKPILDKEGLNIYNCNKNSKLEVFDYIPFEEAVNRSLENMGGLEWLLDEKSEGMYVPPEDKLSPKKDEK